MNMLIYPGCRLDRTGLSLERERGTERMDGNCMLVVRRTNGTNGSGNGNIFLTATVHIPTKY